MNSVRFSEQTFLIMSLTLNSKLKSTTAKTLKKDQNNFNICLKKSSKRTATLKMMVRVEE
jgi:hypothetical protein